MASVVLNFSLLQRVMSTRPPCLGLSRSNTHESHRELAQVLKLSDASGWLIRAVYQRGQASVACSLSVILTSRRRSSIVCRASLCKLSISASSGALLSPECIVTRNDSSARTASTLAFALTASARADASCANSCARFPRGGNRAISSGSVTDTSLSVFKRIEIAAFAQ